VIVRFDATLDEFVDLGIRAWRRNQVALPLWRRDPVIGGGITAAVLYLAMGPPLGSRLAVAAIGFVLGAVIFPLFRQWSLRRNSVRSYAEWLGGRPSTSVEVEPRARGLWVAQNDAEILYPWRNIVAVADSTPDVEIHSRYGGLIVVRSRGFPDAAARSAFIADVRQGMAGKLGG
jgi:hypothetical protein